jgi:hypothetical protein
MGRPMHWRRSRATLLVGAGTMLDLPALAMLFSEGWSYVQSEQDIAVFVQNMSDSTEFWLSELPQSGELRGRRGFNLRGFLSS